MNKGLIMMEYPYPYLPGSPLNARCRLSSSCAVAHRREYVKNGACQRVNTMLEAETHDPHPSVVYKRSGFSTWKKGKKG